MTLLLNNLIIYDSYKLHHFAHTYKVYTLKRAGAFYMKIKPSVDLNNFYKTMIFAENRTNVAYALF